MTILKWKLKKPFSLLGNIQIFQHFNPLTAGVAYIRVFIFYKHIKYHLSNMLKMNYDINQQYLKTVDLHFSNLNNFHSLEVVDRVSETQLQVGENSDWIIWRLKGETVVGVWERAISVSRAWRSMTDQAAAQSVKKW